MKGSSFSANLYFDKMVGIPKRRRRRRASATSPLPPPFPPPIRSTTQTHPFLLLLRLGQFRQIPASICTPTGIFNAQSSRSSDLFGFFPDQSRLTPSRERRPGLFTAVRDSLGLTYDVSFELNLFVWLKLGWYVISVTLTPGKAKWTLLMRHEAESKLNAYWLESLAHLQAASVPRKNISCIKDLNSLYEGVTVEDIYLAYDQLKIDESSMYSCVGVVGAQVVEEISGKDLCSCVV
ncbi:hypothetical protein RHMOL_Rhmol02G0150500 [Rhododendron molle]|uniref:Uncharacterized protein n=1 Tax=Rhododendron molle TaxID=49168 RepID=A0ACC0PRP7_RHOML|nr:hypothetical protein RHMOL_Rhmol02G0150500 [Rhododendron molle]